MEMVFVGFGAVAFLWLLMVATFMLGAHVYHRGQTHQSPAAFAMPRFSVSRKQQQDNGELQATRLPEV
jgi:hypothetical protein